MSQFTDLIDFVNDAKTDYDRIRADGFLAGWCSAMAECGRQVSFVEADLHSMARFPDRPLCCGVLLDWKPS